MSMNLDNINALANFIEKGRNELKLFEDALDYVRSVAGLAETEASLRKDIVRMEAEKKAVAEDLDGVNSMKEAAAIEAARLVQKGKDQMDMSMKEAEMIIAKARASAADTIESAAKEAKAVEARLAQKNEELNVIRNEIQRAREEKAKADQALEQARQLIKGITG